MALDFQKTSIAIGISELLLCSSEPSLGLLFIHSGPTKKKEADLFQTRFSHFEGFSELFLPPGQPLGLLSFKSDEKPILFLQTLQASQIEERNLPFFYEFVSFSPNSSKIVFYFHSKIAISDLKSSIFSSVPRCIDPDGLKLKGNIEIFGKSIEKLDQNDILKQLFGIQSWNKTKSFTIDPISKAFNVSPFLKPPFLLTENSLETSPVPLDSEPDEEEKSAAPPKEPQSQEPNWLKAFYLRSGEGIPLGSEPHAGFGQESILVVLENGISIMFSDEQRKSFEVYCDSGSVVLLRNQARFQWKWGVASRLFDRTGNGISKRKKAVILVLRKKTKRICQCKFSLFCDSQENEEVPPEKLKTKEIEREFVKESYEKIADCFSETRAYYWPGVAQFLRGLDDWDVVLDIGMNDPLLFIEGDGEWMGLGCGNGKYLGLNKRLVMVGTDLCGKLVRIAEENSRTGCNFISDSLRLPLRNECVDHVISVAVIHHFSTNEKRLQALREACRVLKSGGTLLGIVTFLSFECLKTSFTR